MRHPKVTVTVEIFPIWPDNMEESERNEIGYMNAMKRRCADTLEYGFPTLLVNAIYTNTLKFEFPDGWNVGN